MIYDILCLCSFVSCSPWFLAQPLYLQHVMYGNIIQRRKIPIAYIPEILLNHKVKNLDDIIETWKVRLVHHKNEYMNYLVTGKGVFPKFESFYETLLQTDLTERTKDMRLLPEQQFYESFQLRKAGRYIVWRDIRNVPVMFKCCYYNRRTSKMLTLTFPTIIIQFYFVASEVFYLSSRRLYVATLDLTQLGRLVLIHQDKRQDYFATFGALNYVYISMIYSVLFTCAGSLKVFTHPPLGGWDMIMDIPGVLDVTCSQNLMLYQTPTQVVLLDMPSGQPRNLPDIQLIDVYTDNMHMYLVYAHTYDQYKIIDVHSGREYIVNKANRIFIVGRETFTLTRGLTQYLDNTKPIYNVHEEVLYSTINTSKGPMQVKKLYKLSEHEVLFAF
jgi:hypothetical protein